MSASSAVVDDQHAARSFDFEDLLEVFEESETFRAGTFVWATYGLLGTTGKRPNRVGTLIPPVALNAEFSVFNNVGVRATGSYHSWEEDLPLARAGDREFTELFEYRYWTAGLGLTYHFNVGEKLDPYVGYELAYRTGRAFCECEDRTINGTTGELFTGLRWLPNDWLYLQAEFGATKVSVLELGFGIRLNK